MMNTGVSYSDFWNMTIGEMSSYLNYVSEQRETEAEYEFNKMYNNAYLIASFVGSVFSGNEIPSIDEFLPNKQENKIQEDKEALKIALMKEQLLDFAYQHNKQAKEI